MVALAASDIWPQIPFYYWDNLYHCYLGIIEEPNHC